MDASMLADDGERIYTDDFSVWEGELNLLFSFLVFLRLVVSRVNHGSIQDEEIGVGSWQSIAIIIDCVRHWQFQQSVRIAFEGEELLELGFECLEILILFILWVIAPYI